MFGLGCCYLVLGLLFGCLPDFIDLCVVWVVLLDCCLFIFGIFGWFGVVDCAVLVLVCFWFCALLFCLDLLYANSLLVDVFDCFGVHTCFCVGCCLLVLV